VKPIAASLAAALVLALPLAASAQYHQTDFPAEEFKARHAAVFEKIGPDAVAVVQGVHQTQCFTLPRQHNTFTRNHGIPTRCRGALRLQSERRAPRGLSLHYGERHREHQQHALLPQYVDAQGRRPGADGLRAGLSLHTSDIGRVWPVRGTYAPWQRELLQFILEYCNAIISRIKPGMTTRQIMDQAKALMESIIARAKFSKSTYEKAARTLVETGGGVLSHTVIWND